MSPGTIKRDDAVPDESTDETDPAPMPFFAVVPDAFMGLIKTAPSHPPRPPSQTEDATLPLTCRDRWSF